MTAGSPRGRIPKKRGPERAGDDASAMFRYSAIGFQVVLTFVVLTLLGNWLDGRYGFRPWGTLGGVALGVVAMFTIMFRDGAAPSSKGDDEEPRAGR